MEPKWSYKSCTHNSVHALRSGMRFAACPQQQQHADFAEFLNGDRRDTKCKLTMAKSDTMSDRHRVFG